jgi:hypothetical protein
VPWKRKRPAREPHPGPLKELQLQHIPGLARIRDSCHAQAGICQDEIRNAHKALDGAAARRRSGYFKAGDLEAAEQLSAQRVRRAGEGIREQRAAAADLGAQAARAAAEAGLTEYDLEYLHPGPGTREAGIE